MSPQPNQDFPKHLSPIQSVGGELRSSNEPYCNQPEFPLDKYFKGDLLNQPLVEKSSYELNNMEL